MKSDWLWDRKITDGRATAILKKPDSKNFLMLAAILLARKNTPREVFKKYLEPLIFCKHWPAIKRKMREDKWAEPRIILWQAIYEKLSDKYRKRGMVFRQAPAAKEPFCESVGKKVALIRREQGLSQEKFAKKIGVSQQLISRIEKGGENISLMTLTNIASALGKGVEINFTTSKKEAPAHE